jgi:autotransporter-associated beta strand protein
MKAQTGLSTTAAVLILLGYPAAQAATITWTGAGSGTNWNETANWGGVLPGPTDEAKFTNTGLTDGRVIVLGAAQTNGSLVIDSTLNFSIGNTDGNTAGHTLTVTNVTRSSGSSGTQTITSDLALPNDTTWTVDGSGLLNAGKITGAGAINKLGVGELRLSSAHSSSRTGATSVSQGILSVTGSGASGAAQLGAGNLFVGNGTDAALFQLRYGNDWNFNLFGDSASITVRNNAVLDLETYYTAAGGRNEPISSLTVEAEGLAMLGKYTLYMGGYLTTNVMMKGGAITSGVGSISPVSGFIVVDPSASEMATISARVSVSQKYSNGTYYTRFLIADTAGVPVDLKCTGTFVNVWDDRDGFDKVGPGVMKITGSNTYGGRSTTQGGTRVQAGTLLVDNTSGAGTGKGYVSVSAGATLGGMGSIGGLESSPIANVSLSGTSGDPAVLAPGSINETTGAHIIGTLTVGSVAQTNNVTFGAYSTLKINFDTTGHCDKLVVNGTLALDATTDKLWLNIADYDALKPGTYTLATFNQLATPGSTFDLVDKPASGTLVYTANSIEYTVHHKRTVIVVK